MGTLASQWWNKGSKNRRTRRKFRPGYHKLLRHTSSGYIDRAFAAYNCDTTGSLELIPNALAQGTTVTTRVGKRVEWCSLAIRGNISGNSACVTATWAVLIVFDKRPRGVLPVITDVLDTISQESFNEDNYSGRFQILRRWSGVVCGNTTTAGQQTSKSAYAFEKYIKLKHRAVYGNAGNGLIADFEQGALYILTVGNKLAGTSAVTANLGFRTRFRDILA